MCPLHNCLTGPREDSALIPWNPHPACLHVNPEAGQGHAEDTDTDAKSQAGQSMGQLPPKVGVGAGTALWAQDASRCSPCSLHLLFCQAVTEFQAPLTEAPEEDRRGGELLVGVRRPPPTRSGFRALT